MSGLADPERLVFVFGSGVRADVFDDLEDPDDLDERNSLYEELFAAEPFGDDLTAAQRTVRQVIANQIFDDQPPEVWVAAQRLLASGLEREEAMAQLGMVFVATMRDLLADERPFDPVAYAAALDRLPSRRWSSRRCCASPAPSPVSPSTGGGPGWQTCWGWTSTTWWSAR